MSRKLTLGILSDIHYAGAAERSRGKDYETSGLANPALRLLLRAHRHFIWLRDPLNQNHRLEQFLAEKRAYDYVIANGDYSCNTGFIGVSDDAACQSAKECLEKLRQAFPGRFAATFGDHELGKISLAGGRGGMRLASWQRARQELGLQPFWRVALGNNILLGVTSSLIALPVFQADTLPEERPAWEEARRDHMAEIREAFSRLQPEQRVLLFCHDPTALPFLWEEESVRIRVGQIEQTIIGHLHSNLILWKSRMLAGMPKIRFLGTAGKRFSSALSQAKQWRPFKVRLCPALAGIELLKDGGYLTASLDQAAVEPAHFEFHRRGAS